MKHGEIDNFIPENTQRNRRTALYKAELNFQEPAMSKHMPDVPSGNRTPKGPQDAHAIDLDKAPAKKLGDVNTSEQGETANIKQNTTNKGFFQGRRIK